MSQTYESFIEEGKTLSLDGIPERIAVLGYPDYDTIKALGLESAIVAAPKSKVPAYIGQIADDVVDTEDLHQPNLEAIASSQPDLIIATGRSKEAISDLEEIAPVFLYETTAESYWKQFRDINAELGKMLGKEEEVDKLIQDIDQRAKVIQDYNDSHDCENSLTLMLSDGEYRDFSKHSRFAFIYQYLKFGVIGHAETDSAHGDEISLDDIASYNPERIFVIDRNKAVSNEDDQELMDHDILQDTQAAKDAHIYELTADLWYLGGGGLESTQIQLDEVAESIGKD